ncbi:MAG: hypothetical protein IPI14_07240 [Polaromonas sp.]|nr:hypothetical protein [Polaromonas sp.]
MDVESPPTMLERCPIVLHGGIVECLFYQMVTGNVNGVGALHAGKLFMANRCMLLQTLQPTGEPVVCAFSVFENKVAKLFDLDVVQFQIQYQLLKHRPNIASPE